MKGWVIDRFLSEDHIRILHKESLLKDFAQCSKPVVLNNIISYLQGDGNQEIKDMLNDVYKDRIKFLDVLQNDDINECVSKVASYTYNSVRPGLTIEELEDMRDTIRAVYNDTYNVPYINTIPSEIIERIINNLLALYRVNKDIEYKNLAYLLGKNKELFKDKPNASARGTIFKSISKRSSELDIILKGIDFLIDALKSKRQPESWRVF